MDVPRGERKKGRYQICHEHDDRKQIHRGSNLPHGLHVHTTTTDEEVNSGEEEWRRAEPELLQGEGRTAETWRRGVTSRGAEGR
jgi:hypothetical protein